MDIYKVYTHLWIQLVQAWISNLWQIRAFGHSSCYHFLALGPIPWNLNFSLHVTTAFDALEQAHVHGS
jgi:hypothetical protein